MCKEYKFKKKNEKLAEDSSLTRFSYIRRVNKSPVES